MSITAKHKPLPWQQLVRTEEDDGDKLTVKTKRVKYKMMPTPYAFDDVVVSSEEDLPVKVYERWGNKIISGFRRIK